MCLRVVSDGVRCLQIAKHEQQLAELNEANEEATARAAGYLRQVSAQLTAQHHLISCLVGGGTR